MFTIVIPFGGRAAWVARSTIQTRTGNAVDFGETVIEPLRIIDASWFG
jgi:hypothetical protein